MPPRAQDPGHDGGAEALQGLVERLRGEPTEAPTRAAAARWISEVIASRRESAGALGSLGQPGRDLLVRPGEIVEVSATLAGLARAAQRVRFTLAGETHEVPVAPDGVARACLPAPGQGCHTLSWELIGPLGVRASTQPTDPPQRVQVVDGAPTLALDGALLLAPPPGLAAGLQALCARGWAWCVVDLDPADRATQLRGAAEALGLPEVATFDFTTDEAGFEAHGQAFDQVFASLFLRRARASGVPLVALAGESEGARSLAQAVELPLVSPASLCDPAPKSWEPLEAAAAALLEARRRAPSEATWRLEQMTGAEASDGNALHTELDNRLAREAVFQAIEGARRSLHLQLYILEESRFADHLVARLIARARAGVRVRVLVDGLYSQEGVLGQKNPVVRALRSEPQIEVRANDPAVEGSPLGATALKWRDHRKLLTIDGAHAFVSGRNGGDNYYTGFDEVALNDLSQAHRVPWLDAHVEVRGPIVRQIDEAFTQRWEANGGDPVPLLPTPAPVGDQRARLILHAGLSDATSLCHYEALIDGAQDHLYVVNDFPVVPLLASAFRRALARGVRVAFLTGCAAPRRPDGSFFTGALHREAFEYLTKARFEHLIRAGVALYELQTAPTPLIVSSGGRVRPYVHAKLVTVDGALATVGSANLDATASFWEREANLVIEDPHEVARLEAALDALIAQSLKIDLDSPYWRSEATWRSLTAALWPRALYS